MKTCPEPDFRAKLRVLAQTMTHREIAHLLARKARCKVSVSDVRNWLYHGTNPRPKRLRLIAPILDREFKRAVKAMQEQINRLA